MVPLTCTAALEVIAIPFPAADKYQGSESKSKISDPPCVKVIAPLKEVGVVSPIVMFVAPATVNINFQTRTVVDPDAATTVLLPDPLKVIAATVVC